MGPDVARAAHASLLHPLDEMSLGFVVAARLSTGWTARYDHMPLSRMIDSYPAEAFDQHERLGRQAIGRFTRWLATSSPELTSLSPSKAQKAVADAVFVVEGQCLDRWAGGGDFDRIRHEADRYALTRHGLTAEEGQKVQAAVLEALDVLHDIRAVVVTAAISGQAS